MNYPTLILCNTKLFAEQIFFSIFIITLIADQLFYQIAPGVSVALFVMTLMAFLIVNRPYLPYNSKSLIVGILLLPPIVQSMFELGFSNILVLVLLLLVLMGDTFYNHLQPRWIRWVESIFALLKSLGRWPWFLRILKEKRDNEKGFLCRITHGFTLGVKILLPSIILLGAFAVFLGNGNVILGSWIQKFLNTLWSWIETISFPSFGHIMFWALVATWALAFLYPSQSPQTRRFWSLNPPKIISPEKALLSLWRSWAILITTNGLFLAANGIDAVYLWLDTKLPAGVTYSQFVHEGVYNLIATVIFSAFVLTAIFEQSQTTTRSQGLKVLALLWIFQDLFLVSSIFLRLKLYVDTYQLSVLRVEVGCFLLLVSTGFILLAYKILFHKSLRWLVLRNILATFILFYVFQFADISGWVANYNVARWEEDPAKQLDLVYLQELGANAWPALLRVVATQKDPAIVKEATIALKNALLKEENRLKTAHWQSWQWRHESLAKQLREELRVLEVKS